MPLEQLNWFTEPCEDGGSAYSLRIRERIHAEETPYQRIEIYDTTDWGKLMVIDGCTMLTARDNFLYHEMMAHPALYIHDDPQRVAIVGGGDCGTLTEVLKHQSIRQVTQIDIDERVTRLSEIHFPELCVANHDPRASLLFGDGIQWLADAEAASLDLVIVDSTDPVGPGEVLFTEDFYHHALDALDEGGLVVQQSESPMIHLPILENVYRNMRTAGFTDIRTLFFPQPLYPSGWWSATLGRKGKAIRGFREEAVKQQAFKTRYYNAEIHRAAFAEPEFFRQARREWLM
jgi:spermidine synthase